MMTRQDLRDQHQELKERDSSWVRPSAHSNLTSDAVQGYDLSDLRFAVIAGSTTPWAMDFEQNPSDLEYYSCAAAVASAAYEPRRADQESAYQECADFDSKSIGSVVNVVVVVVGDPNREACHPECWPRSQVNLVDLDSY